MKVIARLWCPVKLITLVWKAEVIASIRRPLSKQRCMSGLQRRQAGLKAASLRTMPSAYQMHNGSARPETCAPSRKSKFLNIAYEFTKIILWLWQLFWSSLNFRGLYLWIINWLFSFRRYRIFGEALNEITRLGTKTLIRSVRLWWVRR